MTEEAKETPPDNNNEAEVSVDLEDGEIEDDDEDVVQQAASAAVGEPGGVSVSPRSAEKHKDARSEEKKSEKKKKHLTEAEKSVLKLHKMERMEREKRDKYRRDQMRNEMEPVDDYAVSLEKALAKVLRKDKTASDEEKEEEVKRGKKRKRKEKQKKQQQQQAKKNRQESPKNGEDEVEEAHRKTDEESSDTESSSEKSEARKRAQQQRNEKMSRDRRERSRERNNEKRTKGRSNASNAKNKRNVGICLYYLQGKCADDNCKFSHDCVQPLKLELCKFYQLDCCAKGDKCLYMHSDFPCRYYHTGIPCPMGDDCKFAHGGPLPESVRQILFKHIETAPKEILGNFPRLSRENAHMMITQAQKSLDMLYNKANKEDSAGKSDNESADASQDSDNQKGDKKEKRNRPSRWQDPEPEKPPSQPQNRFKDQDMRVNSCNGDIDMRTNPPIASSIHPTDIVNPNIFATKPPPIISKDLLWINKLDLLQQTNLLNPGFIAQASLFLNQAQPNEPPASVTSIDIEKYKQDAAKAATDLKMETNLETTFESQDDDENALHIVMDEEINKEANENLINMPRTQRELFERIQQQQKFNAPLETDADHPQIQDEDLDQNDWYSDDEDDNKLTIEHNDEEEQDPEEKEQTNNDDKDSPQEPESTPVPADLSKIDIPAEVSKLLSSLAQNNTKPQDPRLKPDEPISRDPRRARLDPEPMTIYEQSGEKDTDLRCDRLGRVDVDLRAFGMPFKSLANYTPASEIDASMNAHPLMLWKVYIVEVPKPDYTGLKLSASDAHTSGDPRLRKIFGLHTEEKDSPASPSASPRSNVAPRIDPRRKRALEQAQEVHELSYTQQLSTLQASPFYQNLTSNQKLMLNQELAGRNDQTGSCDPIISAMLSHLGLQAVPVTHHTAAQNAQAVNILNAITQFNPLLGVSVGMMNNPPPNMGQGLLGPGPTHMQEFGMQYDPRAGGPTGLLGNAPMGQFGGQEFGGGPMGNQAPGNYNDDFYEQGNAGYQGNAQRMANNANMNQRRGGGGGGPGGGGLGGNGRNNRNNRNNYFRRQNKNRHRNNSPS